MSNQLLDFLGFDNIEVIGELVQNRKKYASEQSEYSQMVANFQEITGWPITEVRYHLSRYNYDFDEALDQYFLSQ